MANNIIIRKMKNILKHICLGVLLLWGGNASAQEPLSATDTAEKAPLYEVKVIARNYGDSIVLRWAPTNAAVWIMGNIFGWDVSRELTSKEYEGKYGDRPDETILQSDSALQTENGGRGTELSQRLNAKPIVPLTLEEMQKRYDSTNLYVGVAAQALYGPAAMEVTEQNSELTNYLFRKNQEQTQRQFLAYIAAEGHPEVADALGLRFVDRNIQKNTTYVYTLSSLIPAKELEVPDVMVMVPAEPFVRTDEFKVIEVGVKQADGYTAVVYWPRNKLSGYFIERSEDGGKSWKKINDIPIFAQDPDRETEEVFGRELAELMAGNVVYRDSLQLKKSYRYRVSGFDAFGDYAPAKESEPFEMVDLIPPGTPVLIYALPTDNKICTLQWGKDTLEPDFKGYVVTFCDEPDGVWSRITDILPPKTTQWVDEQAGERGRGYYRVFAIDEAGNISYSLALINNIEDVVPPMPPTGLDGMADSNGIVFLQWERNPEKDVLGYRVYFANQDDHDFVELTGGILEDSLCCFDTLDLHTLSPFRYYYVVAEDNSHNLSEPSDTVAIPVPDIVPPGVALLIDHTEENEFVTIHWLKSTSSDVASYHIYRKMKNQQQWRLIQVLYPDSLKGDTITFTDSPVPSRTAYQYCIEVFDQSRLTSGKTGEVTVHVYGSPTVKVDITLTSEVKKGGVNLKWNYDYRSEYDHYGVIYRNLNNGGFEAVGSFQRGETDFTDSSLQPGDKAEYYVQLVLGKGRRSTPSNTVKVTGR